MMKWRNPINNRRFSTGMEITDTSVKWVQLLHHKNDPSVVQQYMIEPLDPGILHEGEIKEPAHFVHILQGMVQRMKVRTKRVHVALPSSQVMVKYMKMPDLPEKKLSEVIDYEVKHNMFFPFEDTIYDFVKWDAVNDQSDVMLVAAPQAIRDAYVDVLEKAGLKPISMEIRALSILRAILASQWVDVNTTFMQVDLQNTAADVSVFHQGKLQIARTIPLLFSPGNVWKAACVELGNELERMMEFYRYTLHNRDHTFSELIVTGDIAPIDDIQRELQKRLSLQVVPFQMEGLRHADEDVTRESRSLAVPIGLALRGSSS